MDISKTGERIKKLRKAKDNGKGWTLERLAQELDPFNPSSDGGKSKLSKWENGKAHPVDKNQIRTLERLASVLGCEPEYLLGCVEHPTVTTSWIAEQIPLSGTTIDELRNLKMECDERKNNDVLSDEALLTQCLAETVVLYMIRDQEHDGVNETLLSLVYRLIGALKILAEYETPHIKGKDFVFGSDGISAEELTEMKRNPPERYRMANWEKEMCEKNIGELLAQHICDLLKSHIEIAEIIERSESNGEK